MIQSEVVLGKVVEKLDLASEWRKKRAAGDGLKPVEAIGLLKRQMDLRPVGNTELIEIGVRSDDPAVAAKLANTIAETFRDFRLEQNRLLKTEAEKANSRLLETCEVEIVDSAIAPTKPIRPNRPLGAAALLFGLLHTQRRDAFSQEHRPETDGAGKAQDLDSEQPETVLEALAVGLSMWTFSRRH